MPNCGCNDYSRTQLLRRAAAEAGRGLPAIETGMPMPAGTGLSRRSFLSRSAGLALAVYGASTLGPREFEEGIASAAAQGSDDRVLVSVFLSGGADSLTMLAPKQSAHPLYSSLRPGLALPEGEGQDFAGDPSLRWHPSMSGLATLHDEGKVTVMPAIGYDDPNQSHFTSRHYWEVGELNPFGRWGWLGRYLDAHGSADNPLQGLTLGWDLQPSLAARDVPVATVSQPDEYDFWANDVGGTVYEAMLNAFSDMGDPATADVGLGQARSAVAATGRLRDQLAPFNSPIVLPGGYPNTSFGRRLAWVVKLLEAGLPLKVVAIESGGYDTHSNQQASLPPDLAEVSSALLAFQRDLESKPAGAPKLSERVMVHVWSEFGRRPRENDGGTDHGAAGASFVIGSKASGQTIGEFPGLASLDNRDNLRKTSDFRSVYCSLLEQWMGAGAAGIIPNAGTFDRPALVNP
ncbi:MAG TPA: DUF1501 domain-containing protein [Thermoleophilaceae bacterium]|jgi:uncharacterized protein (DUF1501 family)|nr:DUF1501 domain-containing protein [Thermoleophilaceae bacterium]